MATVITVRNVNEALPLGLNLVAKQGRQVVSRGKATQEVPGPVMTVYNHPTERVLFDAGRDANPFFHFFESMWILAGAETTALPAYFLPRITDYSDTGSTFHGAYGYRMRHWGPNGMDQVDKVVSLLCSKPDTRQAVISIWDPERDLGATTKDTPCNDMIMFKVRDDRLHMTVCNRSNDVIWGAYGANVVQFSILQEFIARLCGFSVGTYTQMSDSYHVYEDLPLWQKYRSGEWQPAGHIVDPYWSMIVRPLIADAVDAAHLERDVAMLNQLAEANIMQEALMAARPGFQSTTFRGVALPMLAGYINHRVGDRDGALKALAQITAQDWRLACLQWVQRRGAK